MASPTFPEPPAKVPASSREEIDKKLKRLTDAKESFGALSIRDRIKLLKKCIDGVLNVADEWADASAKAVGLDPNSEAAGESWLAGPVTVVRNLRLLIESLEEGGRPKPPSLEKKHGQHIAQVFPLTTLDKLIFTGTTAHVWIEPGKEPTQAKVYRDKNFPVAVSLVLGAGNVSAIGPTDALYKLFVENQLVIMKMNPVNEYVGPFIERAFKVLVDKGYFALAYGGAEVGKILTVHDHVETIHITGSDSTHDMIVWGDNKEEQAKNKAAGTPKNPREITSELGCVTPVLVVPGPWTDKEIDFQARHVASMMSHNGSFNCNAAKILVTAKGWSKRQAFLDAFHRVLKEFPVRKAYYPGAQKRYDGFLENYKNATPYGERSEEVIPWTVLPDVKPDESEYALHTEAFCGIIAEVAIDADDAPSFLEKAVPFANDKCWGTLSCMMLVHPVSEKQHKSAYENAIANLRYGGIAVNCWAGLIFGLMSPTWGAFPGHPLDDIRSGRGVVHNTFMFDHPQKSVVKAPFVIKPKPVWFTTHKSVKSVAQKLIAVEASPSYFKLPALFAAALKG